MPLNAHIDLYHTTIKNILADPEFANPIPSDEEPTKKHFENIIDSLEYGTSKEFLANKYQITLVEQFGGEGEGDTYYYVVKIQDKHFMIPGWYSSDYGSELNWDDVHEVEPYEKVITDYRAI